MKTKSNMTVKENKLNKQLNGLIDNQPTNTGLIKPNKQNISLCHSCYCMTKTIKGKCGKCGVVKQNKDREEFEKILKELLGPKETPETRLGGGIIDWKYQITKDGFNYVVDKLFDFVQSYTQKKVEEALNNILEENFCDLDGTYDYDGIAQDVIDLIQK